MYIPSIGQENAPAAHDGDVTGTNNDSCEDRNEIGTTPLSAAQSIISVTGK